MTREELKEHCEKQIEQCKLWAKHHGEEPSGKIYEEHKLILELLEQEHILDKIRAEIEQLPTNTRINWDGCCPDPDYPEIEFVDVSKNRLLSIIDKYKSKNRSKE